MPSIPTKPSQLTKSGTPLVRFWGNLVDLNFRNEQGVDTGVFNYADIQVLEVEEGSVYEYPVAQLSIKVGVHERSSWGKLLSSLEPLGVADLLDLKGKRVLMVKKADFFTDRQTNEKVEFSVWRIAEVEGLAVKGPTAAAGSDSDVLLGLLQGKTAAEWAQAALQTDAGKRNSAHIYDQALISGWLAAGAVTKGADERFSVVART